MKKTISVFEKRFLILWTIFHLTAIILYSFHISGKKEVNIDSTGQWASSSPTERGWTYSYIFNKFSDTSYTSTDNLGILYPFTDKFFSKNYRLMFKNDYELHQKVLKPMEKTTFNGIFVGYDYSEFVVYMLLGFGIVFIRKIW